MEQKRIKAAMDKARGYIDALTVDSPVNVPEEVMGGKGRFFTWDNEKRDPAWAPYLYNWSYYTGVVMEGLFDIWQADPEAGGAYLGYVRRYLDAMIVRDGHGGPCLDRERAGYVDHHGADCYKTAALLQRLAGEDGDYREICRRLYRDLTDETHGNSAGHIVAREYTEEGIGWNYWHTWAKDKPPRYKVWLDGLYMLQPFLARFAAMSGDAGQLELVNRRLDWVARTLRAPNGLYYHAGSGAGDVCPYHWTRAMGWYGMAMADVMEVLPEEYLEERREALRTFVEGVLPFQGADGMWTNVTDRAASDTNRPEVSGTAMLAYTILKGVRRGWLEESFRDSAVRAFTAMTETKIKEGHLTDIYLRASANGSGNYENPDFYLPDEGKGVGPYIMAYSEMLYL